MIRARFRESDPVRQIQPPRWLVTTNTPSAPLVAVLANVSEPRARHLGQLIGDEFGQPLVMVHESRGPRRNPTLVHHGIAQRALWHVLGPSGQPAADLYVGEREARKIAHQLADYWGAAVRLVENYNNRDPEVYRQPSRAVSPRRLNPAGAPRKGEVWTTARGGRCKILATTPTAVQVLHVETGNREWIERGEFMASYRPPRPTRNRRGRNPGGPRIVYNRLLGGWYVVVGPHQTPLNGRFDSKADAQAWLSGGAGRRNPTEPIAYGQVILRDGVQEWYETASRHARIRAAQLRKAGFRVHTEASSQVTPHGRMNMTLLDARGDVENLPPVRVERSNPSRSRKARKARSYFLAGTSRKQRRAAAGGRYAAAGYYARRTMMRVREAPGRRTPNPRGRNPRPTALEAYNDGKRAGKADRLLGRRSDYAWFGVGDSDAYTRNYARGYRAGWEGATNPRAPFQAGERVTVPYTGRASYFGRKVTRTREHATIEGVNPDGTALVLVRRGAGVEQHTFPLSTIRRLPQRGSRAVASRVGRVRARLELKDLRSRRRATVAAVERAERDLECLEARAKLMDPESTAYRNAVARASRLRNELEAERLIAADLERQDPAALDPFAIANPTRSGPGGTVNISRVGGKVWIDWSGADRDPDDEGLYQAPSLAAAEAFAAAWTATGDLGAAMRALKATPGTNPLPRGLDPRSIRTVRAGTSRVRVGCARGQYHPRARGRRKCAGPMRAFEVLTRRVRKPRTRKNPGHPGELARTRRLFHQWNSDAEPRRARLTRVRVPARPRALARLGELVSLTYKSDKYAGTPDNPKGRRQLYEHETKRPRPVIAADQNGHVHLVGGRMKPTADGLIN